MRDERSQKAQKQLGDGNTPAGETILMILLPMSDDVRRLNMNKLGEIEAPIPASKYKNVRTEAKGLRFQSGHEATEIGKLIVLDEKHIVFGLRLQVKFPLPGGNSYVADAVYLEFDERIGQLVIRVVDAKPLNFQTKEFKIKAKLFAEKYGQDIELL